MDHHIKRLLKTRSPSADAVIYGNFCSYCVTFSTTIVQDTFGDSQLLFLNETMRDPMNIAYPAFPTCQSFVAGIPELHRIEHGWIGLKSIWHAHCARESRKGKHALWFDTTIDGCVTIERASKADVGRFLLHDVHYEVNYSGFLHSMKPGTRKHYPEMVDFDLCVLRHEAQVKDIQRQQTDNIYASAYLTLIAAADNIPISNNLNYDPTISIANGPLPIRPLDPSSFEVCEIFMLD
ncbi:hypothetical protein J1614_005114 [Plenodomus biglobosus]|nr:hypothetical protein J1614_005114 [Plenodomus biglobosus]